MHFIHSFHSVSNFLLFYFISLKFSSVKQRKTAHLEHLLLTMPLHPGILHLPFSEACKGQWSVRSLRTGSGGTKLWGPLLFFPTTTACEGLPFLLFLTLFSMHRHEAFLILKANSGRWAISGIWDCQHLPGSSQSCGIQCGGTISWTGSWCDRGQLKNQKDPLPPRYCLWTATTLGLDRPPLFFSFS